MMPQASQASHIVFDLPALRRCFLRMICMYDDIEILDRLKPDFIVVFSRLLNKRLKRATPKARSPQAARPQQQA